MFYMHHNLYLIIKINVIIKEFIILQMFLYFIILYTVLFAKEINSPRC